MKKALSLIFLLFFATFARADDFYCMFFAADSIHPKHCHVWGTFVQMKEKKLVKEVTISWSPEGKWNILDRQQRGRDLSLHQSIQMAGNTPICIWGPFIIDEDLFKKAEKQYLTPGNYKMMDAFSKPKAMNCIHRLSTITDKRLISHVRYGKFAASAIYKHYNKLKLIKPSTNIDAITEALDIKKYQLRKMQ